ncbi:hypothetical protein B0H67DRAFT_129347 [Lasiosphaeris hirsuta]|uniref:Uncharacterized protein n=1 Tax=Lasiosphaeris hirsuta TaxID=260670 RepID=A0AA40B0F7_9PEZI|nr:hypothetical protein B0H67DRAFT_129347 [Lasiosphaeris hirsuta]
MVISCCRPRSWHFVLVVSYLFPFCIRLLPLAGFAVTVAASLEAYPRMALPSDQFQMLSATIGYDVLSGVAIGVRRKLPHIPGPHARIPASVADDGPLFSYFFPPSLSHLPISHTNPLPNGRTPPHTDKGAGDDVLIYVQSLGSELT